MNHLILDSPPSYTEISLYGQIPQSRHDQLLQILAGVSGMAPQQIFERHLIYKPTQGPVQKTAQVGGSQGVQDSQKKAAQKNQAGVADSWYLRLVEEIVQVNSDGETVDEGVGLRRSEDEATIPSKQPTEDISKWSLRFYDLPEAGKRPINTRNVMIEEINGGDAISFMSGLGYSFVSEHVAEGHKFVYKNVILALQRILRRASPRSGPSNGASHQAQKTPEEMPSLSECTPVDESGSYLLQASVRVQDGRQLETMSKATQELLRFKELMKGIADLRMVDRLALDTRVK